MTVLNPKHHDDADDDDTDQIETYSIDADLWLMIRSSPDAQAKWRFRTQMAVGQ